MLTYNGKVVGNGSGGWVQAQPSDRNPYIVFEFDATNFVPTMDVNLSNGANARVGRFTRVSSEPNRWKWTCRPYLDLAKSATGVQAAFSVTDTQEIGGLSLDRVGNMPCRIVDWCFLDDDKVQTTDRMFQYCTALDSIPVLPVVKATNTSAMFKGCTNADGGALDLYNYIKANGVSTNHAGMFEDCGSDTTTGVSELAQIPTSWGGTYVPPSTSLASTVNSSPKSCWKINSNSDYETMVGGSGGLYIFTTSSISAYAGVSMNRSRCYNKVNGFSNASSATMFFRPCFFQNISNTVPNSSTTVVPSYILTTPQYIDSLASGASNRDMSGTLDYNTYGAASVSLGTYSSSLNTYFGILVTNNATVTGLSDPLAFLFNSNYKTDAGLQYFHE